MDAVDPEVTSLPGASAYLLAHEGVHPFNIVWQVAVEETDEHGRPISQRPQVVQILLVMLARFVADRHHRAMVGLTRRIVPEALCESTGLVVIWQSFSRGGGHSRRTACPWAARDGDRRPRRTDECTTSAQPVRICWKPFVHLSRIDPWRNENVRGGCMKRSSRLIEET